MNRVWLILLYSAGMAMAESFSGTLVDVMCKGKDVAGHTRQCAVNCAKGGYGLVLADGKFVKLDESGNAMALSKLKTSTKFTYLNSKVTGKLDAAIIAVDSIDLQ